MLLSLLQAFDLDLKMTFFKKKLFSQLQFRSIGIKLSTETSGDLLLVVHTLGGVTGISSNSYSIIY